MLSVRAPWRYDPVTLTWRWDERHYLVAQRGPGTRWSVWRGGGRLGSAALGPPGDFACLDEALAAAEDDCFKQAVRKRASLLEEVEELEKLLDFLAGAT